MAKYGENGGMEEISLVTPTSDIIQKGQEDI